MVAKHLLVQEKLAKKEKKALSGKKPAVDPPDTIISKSPDPRQTRLPYRKRDIKLASKVDMDLLECVSDNHNVAIGEDCGTITINMQAIRNAK